MISSCPDPLPPASQSYFNQLNYRTSGGSSAHSALSSLPRSIISDITPPPSLDALGTDQLTVSAAIGQGLAHFLPVRLQAYKPIEEGMLIRHGL